MSEPVHPVVTRPGPVEGPTDRPGPSPHRLAGVLARAWLEIRDRKRPLSQLAPLLAPAVHRRLEAQVRPPGSAVSGRPRVRRVTTDRPREGVCEAVVVVDDDTRTTAVAVRLERHRGAWRAVDLGSPEAGLPALRTASAPVGQPRPDAFDEALSEER